MQKLFLSFIFIHAVIFSYGQNEASMAPVRKAVFSIGADLVPIASVNKTTSFGFGGSLAYEVISTPKTSFVVNAGYLLFAAYPFVYSGYSGDLEFIPVSLTLRKFVKNGFYVGPRAGLNIEAASPQYDDFSRTSVTPFGGVSLGFRPKQKRIFPDFSFLYHHASYGSIFSFQSSIRYAFR